MSCFATAIRVSFLTIVLLGTALPPASAQTTQIPFNEIPPSATTITFETTPQGAVIPLNSPVANIWASIGVTFDGNDTVTGPFTLRTPPNVLSAGPTTTSAIRSTFSPSVSVVGAWGFDFVMEAFDGSGNSLMALTHTDGSAGLYGGAAEYGFLGVTSTTPIARVEFRHAFPSNQAFGFHIDDLVFVPGPPPPPRHLIAFTEFNEPPVGAGSNTPGATDEELGFATVTSPSGGVNPLAGVADLSGERVLSHRSIDATTTFSFVDITNYDDVNVFARVHVANTNWEAGDLVRVFATNGIESVDLLNASGTTALTNLAGDNFLMYGAAIPGSWTQVALVVTSSSDSSQASERFDIDSIEFRGVLAVPEPSTSVMVALAVIIALGAFHTRRQAGRA